jgi:F-type H+-transporting ATPase subunit delta
MVDKKATQHSTVFDTDRQYLGDVYAKALLSVSKESGNMDQVLDELDSFTDAMSELAGVRATMESPRVAVAEKIAVFEKITKGSQCSTEFQRFIKVLINKGRFDCLSAIRSSANNMFNEMAGRVEASVVTAEAIDDSLKKKIAEKLSAFLGKEVLVSSTVDPGILGGMVVRVGDTVFDSSIANELKRVRRLTIQRASEEIRNSLDRFASG